LQEAGLNTAPVLGLPVAVNKPPVSAQTNLVQALLGQNGIQTSPLQMALAIAALNNSGIRPAPRLVQAMKTPEQGWVELLKQGKGTAFLPAEAAARAADMLAQQGLPIWQAVADMRGGKSGVTWYLGGTLPGRQSSPLTLVVLLEEDDPILAVKIGQAVLQSTINGFTIE
jgi:membrane peptidoglycan carboxypeptidase